MSNTPLEMLETYKRATLEILPEKDFAAKLESSQRFKKPLRIKLGIDPTAPDIHLGHTVVMRKLRQFQRFGHHIILIIGDFTAKIGDPTGRSETRKVLTDEEIKANTKTYLEQIGKIVDTENPETFELVYNSTWLAPLNFHKILELSHHFTVAQLLEREDFSNRYHSGKPIGLHEFFYPIMQGYDSVAIKADVELGGTDQKFNILVGRELQRIYGVESPQVAMLLPILEGTDGIQKMSKSLGNYIGINEPPDEMFGKIMSIPDTLIRKYFELLTDFPMNDVREKEDPREWKVRLGALLVDQFHGAGTGEKAKEHFDRVFREKKAPEQMEEYQIATDLIVKGEVSLAKLLTAAQLAPSMREAKRVLMQGGVVVNGTRVSEENAMIEAHDGTVIQVGKRKFIRIRLK